MQIPSFNLKQLLILRKRIEFHNIYSKEYKIKQQWTMNKKEVRQVRETLLLIIAEMISIKSKEEVFRHLLNSNSILRCCRISCS